MSDVTNANLDVRFVRRITAFTAFSSLFTAAVGGTGLAGWVFNIPQLRAIFPGMMAIKPNTSVCLVLLASALWLQRDPEKQSQISVYFARFLAVIAAAVGLLSALEYLGGWNFGIDQLLFTESLYGAAVPGRPGLMSPLAALSFVLLGSALSCLDSRIWNFWVAQILAFSASVASLLGIVDYVVHRASPHTYIALPTTTALFVFSLGVMCARPHWGLGGLLSSCGLGGIMARRLLPLSVVVPVLIGWLRWYAEERGLYSEWGGLTIMILSMVVLLVTTTGWTAFVLDRSDCERQKTAQEARRASLYARSLIEASLDPLVTISKDGKIMDVNRATELATGISRDHLVGSDFSNYFTEPEKARSGYEEAFASGTVRDYPLSLRHTSGNTLEVLYNAAVYKNEAGEVEGIFAAARDITARKRAEQEVRKASLYARSLIEASLDPLVTIRKDGKIMDVNQATEAATGLTRAQLIGSDFSNYFTEPEKARAGYEQVFATGMVRDYPLSLRHSSGRVTDVLYNASVYKNEAGEVEGVFAAARDVTERNQAELALLRSEQRYRSLVVASSQVIWTTNRQGEVAGDMPMWREFTGQNYEDMQGWGWSEMLHPADREHTAAVWSRAVQNRTLYDSNFRMRRRDGEYRYMAVRGVPVLEADGSIREWIGTCTDITERRKAEEQIRQLNEQLEQRVLQRTAQLEASNKELEAFTYSVSHDLRAPLRHIAGFAKMLAEEHGSRLDENGRHYLHRISEGVQRMGQLVDDLLNLARVGRKELGLQVTGLGSIVQEVIADLKPEMEGRDVDWKISGLPFVECDPALMKQVFQNLLANALKFTRPRAHAVIEVGQTEHDGGGVVFVRDNGVGFSMKYADKLFGVFQRLHRPEDFEGTGVGLATVQRIIAKHGGKIWAEAELDKGASFYFTLGTATMNLEPAQAAAAGAQL